MLAVTVRCDSVGTLSLLTSHYHSGHKGTTGSTQSREHCSQSREHCSQSREHCSRSTEQADTLQFTPVAKLCQLNFSQFLSIYMMRSPINIPDNANSPLRQSILIGPLYVT